MHSQTMAVVTPWICLVLGGLFVLAGIGGACFTARQVARERIVIGSDAPLAGHLVRGPRTLLAQSSVIERHTLTSSEGKRYAEMPRQVAQVDAEGNPVLDAEGAPVMVGNEARQLWVTATTLRTALHLAVLAYGVSLFAVLNGAVLVLIGIAIKR